MGYFADYGEHRGVPSPPIYPEGSMIGAYEKGRAAGLREAAASLSDIGKELRKLAAEAKAQRSPYDPHCFCIRLEGHQEAFERAALMVEGWNKIK